MDVTLFNDGDILYNISVLSEQLAKGPYIMIGIPKEKSLKITGKTTIYTCENCMTMNSE